MTLHVAWLLLIHLVLAGLPIVAAALVAIRLGQQRLAVVLAIGLATSGVLAMLGFWAYYWCHPAGLAVSWGVPIVSALAIVWALTGPVDRELLTAVATPILLWAFASAFIVALGFVHLGETSPVLLAQNRFSPISLPSDNEIPHFFMQWYYDHGHVRPPVFPGPWLSSDRPPLQIGYILLQRPFVWDGNELNYEIIGVTVQSLWVIGLWAILAAVGMRRLTRALTAIAVLLSPLVIVNSFFVWPKLLAGTMLLPVVALIMTSTWAEIRRTRGVAALIIVLLTLGMLSHGSVVFTIIPLILYAIYRGLPSPRWILVGLAAGAVLYVPWTAYQKYADPPGNRLEKWMLAGDVPINHKSVGQTIEHAYAHVGLGGAVHNKAENFVTITGGKTMALELKQAERSAVHGHPGNAIGSLQVIMFFYLLPSLALLLLAPVAMALRRRRPRDEEEWSISLRCWVLVAAGVIVWCVVMFGNNASRAVVHQGSYAIPILMYTAAVVGVRSVLPRAGAALVGLNCLLMLAVYGPAFWSLPGTRYSGSMIALGGLALAAFATTALWDGTIALPSLNARLGSPARLARLVSR